jgi:predicted hydrocarbon binding protein
MDITLLDRRIVEAEAIGPVFKAFASEIGFERAVKIMQKVHTDAARGYGRQLAQEMGSARIADLAKLSQEWGSGGALEEEILEQTETTYFFNVTRCRFAEEYERLGLRDAGVALSCCRDVGFIEGFNPKIKMVRTKTVMEGHDCCDFRYTLEE